MDFVLPARITRALLACALLISTGQALAEESTRSASPVHVVYHIDNAARAAAALRNIRNHRAADPQVQIVVVALANGVRFLADGAEDAKGNPFEPMIDDLSFAGVEFRACNNSLVGMKLSVEDIHAEVQVVASGVEEIGRLQFRQGYAYIKP